ncbi:MAG: thiol peroxidase [Cytophagaceae bacterium]|jgi:thiol peroxidase|nr:thiol peroxidase [Cytophagaceae bacterium]
MTKVTLKGNPITIKGTLPGIGQPAPDFTYVKTDLSEETLYSAGAVVKVIIAVPSLDTSVCALETRQFNQKLAQKTGIKGIVVSKDLPFAMKRFCETEGIANVSSGSDFRYNEFSQKYNTEILEGGLKGLSARAVVVVDQQNVVRYTELVPEIAQEPEYDKVLQVVDQLLS